uniref:NADH dehydrogenase subunit 5 n=1 Tax=Cunedda sp. 1 SJ-2023a TaxID=3040701 RepID=UPI002552026E|nr:NADH dehydrogenase subunit 5 [Cunedda sp. 1 SJ-2023a]WGC89450.1 NADH dehydrogenase subunit 5 [Cunedda sp. 1 SJ-2023a]
MIKTNFYLVWFYMMLFISMILFYYGMIFNMIKYSLIIEFSLLTLNSVNVSYILLFDYISLMFCSVVMFISSMVIMYSYSYMGGLSNSSIRFLFLVILFIMSMILMIMSPNLLSIMLGWDGLGLVSYCLVIYYMSNNSYLAGLITCLTNRIGDVGLLICISWMISFGSWHFIFYKNYFDDYLSALMIMSCFTKSAQIPFSCWLPAAMAAPTPVSSLVHSSTLVTAGVYLLIRFSNQLYFNKMLLFLSLLTMIFSSICANYEFDLKKIIALSTLSQLGLMMVSLLLNMIDLSFFHLLTHAMFKSLLFLCSGIFIFYMNDNQDIRLMGVVCNTMPFTTSCFNISTMALCGIPFLSGFYSKDLIIESYINFNMNTFMFMLMYMSLGLTASYSIRLCYYCTMCYSKLIPFNLIIDQYSLMKLSVYFLTFFSVFFGSMQMWMINLDLMLILMPLYLKLMSFLMVMIGFWLGLEVFNMSYMLSNNFYFMNYKMWFLFSHSHYLYKYFYKMSMSSNKYVMIWGEYYGVMGMSYYLMIISVKMQNLINNNIKMFLVTFLIWFIFFI